MGWAKQCRVVSGLVEPGYAEPGWAAEPFRSVDGACPDEEFLQKESPNLKRSGLFSAGCTNYFFRAFRLISLAALSASFGFFETALFS